MDREPVITKTQGTGSTLTTACGTLRRRLFHSLAARGTNYGNHRHTTNNRRCGGLKRGRPSTAETEIRENSVNIGNPGLRHKPKHLSWAPVLRMRARKNQNLQFYCDFDEIDCLSFKIKLSSFGNCLVSTWEALSLRVFTTNLTLKFYCKLEFLL